MWSRTMGGAGDDRSQAMAVDVGGNVYLTGYFNSKTVDFDPGVGVDVRSPAAGSRDIFVTKLNTDGSYGWTRNMGGVAYDGSGRSIAVDAKGSVYVAGAFQNAMDFDPTLGADYHSPAEADNNTIFVTKLKADGSYGWTRSMGGSGNDGAQAVAVDGVGNIYAAGSYSTVVDFDPGLGVDTRTSSGQSDIFVTKLNINYTLPDADKDAVTDAQDAFPNNPSEYVDTDRDGIGNSADPDADNDGLPNSYEISVTLNPLNAADATMDHDKDGLVNTREFQLGTHPKNADTDGDRMPDGYEVTYGLNPLAAADAALDKDGDGLSNLSEYSRGTNPTLADTDGDGANDAVDAFPLNNKEWLDTDRDGTGNNADTDDDNDGMPDTFETTYGLNPLLASDAGLDGDGDGLTNLDEYKRGTNPNLKDTDGDGVADNLDILPTNSKEWLDSDKDGLGNNADLDDDNDGMPDSYELANGFNPLNAADASLDFDGDGVTNLKEYQHGTNPRVADASYTGPEHAYAWTKTMGGAGDERGKVVVDSNGNIYIVGQFTGTADFDPGAGTDFRTSAGFNDIFLTKLNADGSYAWTKTIGGAGGESMATLAFDALGSIYLIGTFGGTVDIDPGAGVDYRASVGAVSSMLVKLNADGSYAWGRIIGVAGITALAVDPLRNIYLAGEFTGTVDFDPGAGVDNRTATAYRNAFLAKINADGSYGWAKTIGGGSTSFASASAVIVDGGGNAYVTGRFMGVVDFDPADGVDNRASMYGGPFPAPPGIDIFLTRFNADGSYLWTKTIGGAGEDIVSSIAVDGSGHAYMVGSFRGAVDFDPGAGIDLQGATGNGNMGAFLTRVNMDGSYGWTKAISPSAASGAYAYYSALSLDGAGNFYLAGAFTGTVDFDPGVATDSRSAVGGWDIFMTKLNADGGYGWSRTMGGAGADSGDSIAADKYGHAYVSGSFSQSVDFDSGAGIDARTSLGASDVFLTKIVHCPVSGVSGCQ